MKSIRWRFMIPFTLMLVIVLGGLSIYLSRFIRESTMNYWRSNLLNQTRLVAGDVETYFTQPAQSDELDRIVENYGRKLSVRVTLIQPDGKVISDSSASAAAMENHLDRPEVQKALENIEDTQERISPTLGIPYLYSAVPVSRNGQVVGIVRLAVSLEKVEASMAAVRNATVGVTVLLILLSILMTLLLTNYTIEPLHALSQSAKQMGLSEPQETSALDRNDEIGVLNQSFQRMSGQLNAKINELETERGKLAAVLANMSDGVLIVDATGKIQLINPAAAKMFQSTNEEAEGRSLIEVTRQHQLVEIWEKSRATGQQYNISLELTPVRFYLQAYAAPLGSLLPGSTLILLQDITRVRRLENVRRDFVSNVSHELRTPLASLKALTETLSEGALEDPPAAHRFLTQMDKEIDNLTQMVQELLELSRIESGRVPLEKQPVQPVDLASKGVERMSLQAERAGLELALDMPDTLPDVIADRERMEQVLINLLHNAIKFTAPGGKITLSAREKDGMVVFQVSDTGVGISEEALMRIFERFYKADRARSGGGTGLGLSIARHLVEAHGGRIWADSTPGEGSNFYFSLPVNKS